MRKKLLVVAGSLTMFIIAVGVVLITFALYRYGGAEGLTDRVRLQFAVEQAHDDFVPTPETSADAIDPAQLAETAAAALNMDTRLAAATAEPANAPVGPRVSTGQALNKLASLMQPPDAGARGGVRLAAAGPQPTATRKPAPTPSRAAPTPTTASSLASAASAPAATLTFPPAMHLEGMAHYWQTWNNCGPATLSMNLSYFGIKIGQEKIGPVLKPEKDDKNVGPEQLAEFARSQRLRSLVRVNGDANRLKALLQAGVPVLVETWYEPKPNDGMGHYKLIVGYDDAGVGTNGGNWIAYDSYDSHGLKKGDPYQGVTFPYASFDQLWKVFGRTYIPVYDDGRAKAVEAILGADMDDSQMWQRALAEDLAYVKANPKDPFAWFNVGTDYVNTGDYQTAAQAFDTARRLKLPWRMLWYQFGPFQAYYAVGRYQEVITLADAAIKTAVNDEELFYWKGLAQQALGDPASAKASIQQAVKLRPTYQDALDALAKLQ